MNFSVHFDEDTVAQLARAVEELGVTRNRIIVRAVQEFLARHESHGWPDRLRDHFRNPAPEPADGTSDLQPWTPDA